MLLSDKYSQRTDAECIWKTDSLIVLTGLFGVGIKRLAVWQLTNWHWLIDQRLTGVDLWQTCSLNCLQTDWLIDWPCRGFRKAAFTLTISSAAVQCRLGGARGDVEEAIHEEGSIGQGGVLRPLLESGEIYKGGQRHSRWARKWFSPKNIMVAVYHSVPLLACLCNHFISTCIFLNTIFTVLGLQWILV